MCLDAHDRSMAFFWAALHCSTSANHLRHYLRIFGGFLLHQLENTLWVLPHNVSTVSRSWRSDNIA